MKIVYDKYKHIEIENIGVVAGYCDGHIILASENECRSCFKIDQIDENTYINSKYRGGRFYYTYYNEMELNKL